jgi:hypothetical protein
MTFGGGGQNFYDAGNRIKNELSAIHFFDNIVTYTDTDLKTDTKFWNMHREFIEHNKRGYGYWLWKPYLILKTMEQMQDNDILFYLDVGCEVTSTEDTYSKLLDVANKCDSCDILYTDTEHDTKSYTKMDLLEYLDMNTVPIKDSIMHQATYIVIKKNETTTKLMKDWYKISCNYHLLDDTPSSVSNDKTFIEHRHDQSIFSLLVNKYNLVTPENILKNSFPVLLSRKKHG